MTSRQLVYLRQLAADYEAMDVEMRGLDDAFREFNNHLSRPGLESGITLLNNPRTLSRNPVSWSDDQTTLVEKQLGKWRSQQSIIEQTKTLLSMSNIALALAEDGFDDSLSDI